MIFKYTCFLLLTLFLVSWCKFGSLSLFHVGGTTFLNLRHPSRRASLKYEYATLGNQQNSIMERLKPILGDSPVEVENSWIWKNTKLGNVKLTNTTLETGLFETPNGQKEYHGWIESENDYLSPEMEVGQEPLLLNVIETLQSHPVRQVSLQVNVEMSQNATTLRDLLINVYRPENRKYIIQDSNFALKTSYTRGFLNKLLSQNNGIYTYEASLQNLFDDLVIRHTLERIGTPTSKAWSFPIEECRQMLLGLNYQHSQFSLDIIPFLLSAFPDDPITIHLSKFITPSNTIQFNEFHGNSEVGIRRAVGIIKATELFGYFISDHLLGQVSNLEIRLIQKIRSKLLENQRVIVKYITWDPEKCARVNSKRARDLFKLYEKDDIILGFISNNLYGHAPLVIPGDSVVWHQRTEHRFNLLGAYNPGLINYNLAHFLESKYYESRYFSTFCPGMFPRTVGALDLFPEGKTNVTLKKFLKAVNNAFPNGWVIKGLWDYNTQSDVLHHNRNYKQLLTEMKNAQFLPWVSKVEKQMTGCEPIEDVNIVVRKTSHFVAWRLWGYLNNISDVMIQEFLELYREFRIEGFGGQMKREWMTNDDHSHKDSKEDHEYYQSRVNSEFEKCIHSLPEKLRATPFTSDIALLKDKTTVKILETNPGGNGYLYHHDEELVPLHNEFLKKYRQDYEANSMIQSGLTGVEQMELIGRLLEEWNLTKGKYDARWTYLHDRIVDLDNMKVAPILKSRLNAFTMTPPIEFVSTGERYGAIRDVLRYLDGDRGVKAFPISEILSFITRISLTKESLSYNEERLNLYSDFKKNEKGLVEVIYKKIHELTLTSDFSVVNDQTLIQVAKEVIEVIPMIHDLSVLNVNQNETLEYLNQVFLEINTRRRHIDWTKTLFGIFDESNREVLSAKSTGFVSKAPTILNSFSRALISFRALNRLGYVVPNMEIGNIIKKWLPDMQNLYTIFEMNDVSQSVHPLFGSLTEAVTTIINIFSDHSLFFLDRSLYQLEYEYLLKCLHHAIKMRDANILGSSLDSLMVLSVDEDEGSVGIISNAREILIKLVDEEDMWKMNGKKSLSATTNAILGLVEHAYLNRLGIQTGFAEMTPLESYKERLNRIGFFKMENHPFFISQYAEKIKFDKKDEL